MKSFLITILCAFFTSSLFSQYLKVTAEGLKSVTNPEKSYFVLEFKDKTAPELYEAVYNYIQRNYKNPEAVIRGQINDEFLSFDTHVDKITSSYGMIPSNMNCNYKTTINFKEGKIKIEFIDIEMYYYNSDNKKTPFSIKYVNGMVSSLFTQKGELRKAGAFTKRKNDIEAYFNSIIKQVEAFIKNTNQVNIENENDDW